MKKFKTISQIVNETQLRDKFLNESELEKMITNLSEDVDYRTFEKDGSYKRLLERVLPVEEASTIEYFGLNESDKNRIDDLIWENVYRYVNTEVIEEGFFDSFVSAAKSIGGKAIEIGKKIVSSIGSWLKAIKEYAVKGLTAAVQIGKKAGDALVGKIKKKSEEKFGSKTKDMEPKALQSDIKNLKETVNYVMNGTVKKVEDGMDDAANAMKAADKQDTEEAIKKLEASKDASKDGEKKDVAAAPSETPKESKLNIYSRVIVELRKPENLDSLNIMCEYSVEEFKNKLNEEIDGQKMGQEAEAEAQDKAKNIVSTVLDKAKAGWKTILHIIVSGVTVFVEKALKVLFSKSLKAFSAFIKAIGGPGVFEFAAISTLAAGVIGLIFEFAGDVVGEEAMPSWINGVSHALHATSLGAFAAKGAEGVVPGAATVIKLIAFCFCLYMIHEHLAHLAHGDAGHGDKAETDKPAEPQPAA